MGGAGGRQLDAQATGRGRKRGMGKEVKGDFKDCQHNCTAPVLSTDSLVLFFPSPPVFMPPTRPGSPPASTARPCHCLPSTPPQPPALSYGECRWG